MSKKNKGNWLTKLTQLPMRTKIIAIGSIVGVIFVVWLVIFIVQINQPRSDDGNYLTGNAKSKFEQKLQDVKRAGAVRDEAASALASGDAAKANKVYSDAISREKDATRKIQLIIDQSELIYNSGKYADAIKLARDNENVSDDKYLIADWLSRLYEDRKQYSLAAEYYTIAGKFATSPTNTTHLTKSYFDSKAARAQALAGK